MRAASSSAWSMRTMSPVVLGPDEFTANGSVRMSGITFPLPSGSTGGNALLAGTTGATGAGPRSTSVMRNVRGLVKVFSGISNWNGLLRLKRPPSFRSRAKASSGGIGTPSTATAGQSSRIPDDEIGKWLFLTSAADRMVVTSKPSGTCTVQSSQIEL